MKLPALLAVLVATIGLSFAAGSYFAPALFHARTSTGTFTIPVAHAASTTIAPGNSAATTSSASVEDLPTILQETNSYRLFKDLTTYADSISAADLPDVVEKVQGLPAVNGNQSLAVAVLAGRWVDLDPEAALARAQKTGGTPAGDMLASNVLSDLAEHDPGTALSQAEQLPAGPRHDLAVQNVLAQMARIDPANALATAQQIPQASARTNAIAVIIGQVAQSDPNKALGMAQQLPDGQAKTQALFNAINQLAQKDPAHAFALSQDRKSVV